ncbi:Protein of unknown function [Cotesia congregata]|uniref:Uncharacterized protein n=1 Tax=Cotesia congregata TaxID=51543 RepID=A0A8J2HBD7_COTCN|nr:Protein of unknown function [Cotesia congregata]
MIKSLFLLLLITIIILSIKINSSKCEKGNSTNSEQILSESRHEYLSGSDGNNNAVNVNNNNDKKPSLMQRVGSMLMMIPLMMQVKVF